MNRFLVFIFASFFFYSCANIIPPTGGPKDEKAPEVVNSIPENGSVNVTGNQIELNFNEDVDATKLESELDIVPRYKGELKIIAKKKKVVIRFLEPLEENTTYTLNFGKGINDLTEKNIAKDLTFSFSTGPVIDSLTYGGTILWLPEKSTSKKLLVGLYPTADTASPFKSKPYYYTSVSTDNSFHFHHLKAQEYKVYSWIDKNDNYILDTLSETAGYRFENLILEVNTDNDSLLIFPAKNGLPGVNSIRYLNSYNLVKLNKGLSGYEILNTEQIFLTCFTSTHKEIMFYSNGKLKDSIKVKLNVTDSLGQQNTELVTLYFDETYPGEREKKSVLKNQLSTEIQYVDEKPKLIIRTDNPIINIDTQQVLIFQKDRKVIWKTKDVDLDVENKTLIINNLNVNYGDSIKVVFINNSALRPYNNKSDTLRTKKLILDKKLLSGLGMKIITNEKNYILQIINSDNEIVVSKINVQTIKLLSFQPGVYTIRAILDTNGNGIWDTGDVVNHVEPENILYYKESINLKANWEIWDIQFKF